MRIRELESDRARLASHWRRTRRLTLLTLLLWALVSFGAIAAVRLLDRAVLFGFPLGYYLGAQGSLLVFVLLIANYARAMNRIDREHDLQEDEDEVAR